MCPILLFSFWNLLVLKKGGDKATELLEEILSTQKWLSLDIPERKKTSCSFQKEICAFVSNYCIVFPFLPGVSVARGKKGES